MQFIHQPLTWGFFLVLLPLLIHLINLMRQRRVEWAAMDFLLEAYKKRRNWIWLKQLLLLLARMLAVAAAVAMLAKLVTRDQWSSFLGGKTTHHYVLLDDSLSMGERLGGGTAFDRAVKATGQLIGQISSRSGQGGTRFTLLRFSRALAPAADGARAGATARDGVNSSAAAADSIVAESPSIGAVATAPTDAGNQGADFNAVVVDQDIESDWAVRQSELIVSELAVGPEAAVDLIAQRIEERDEEQSIVYVMSDFRSDRWDAPKEIGVELAGLEEAGASIRLVRCVETKQSNLAVTNIRPVDGVFAAGVPLYVEISVHNYGDQPATQVPVSLSTLYFSSGAAPSISKGSEETLPDVLFEEIPAGRTVARRTQVFFPTAGQHVVKAELPADALAGDNRRRCIVNLPASVPVLVIDHDVERRNAEFLSTVFQPSQRVETGVAPVIQSPAYLRDAVPGELAKYASVYILDCESLDQSAVRRLEEYARNGGGVAVFLGPSSRPRFYRDWYRDGTGLFPVPVQKMDLLEPSLDNSPDMVVQDHPLFKMLLGQRNSFLGRIRVSQYHRTRFGWKPPEQSGIRVIANLRNGQPLVVERPFGRGRIVATLTTLAPTWNTWAMEPTFVVFLLELQAYLQQPSIAEKHDVLVGSPLELVWDPDTHQREVVLTYSPDGKEMVAKTHNIEPNTNRRWGSVSGESETTMRSGLYEAWVAGLDGVYSVERQAVNIDPVESDLSLATPQAIAESLPTKQLQLLSTADLADATAAPQSFSLAQALLIGLLILLVVEQLLSYSASYHTTPSVRAAARPARASRLPTHGATR